MRYHRVVYIFNITHWFYVAALNIQMYSNPRAKCTWLSQVCSDSEWCLCLIRSSWLRCCLYPSFSFSLVCTSMNVNSNTEWLWVWTNSRADSERERELWLEVLQTRPFPSFLLLHFAISLSNDLSFSRSNYRVLSPGGTSRDLWPQQPRYIPCPPFSVAMATSGYS